MDRYTIVCTSAVLYVTCDQSHSFAKQSLFACVSVRRACCSTQRPSDARLVTAVGASPHPAVMSQLLNHGLSFA